jgi:hypothetical protein
MIGTVTMGINTVGAGFATGSDSIATINITGGVTTVTTAFSMGAQNSVANAATTVNTATSTLNVSSGSLILSGTTDLKMGSTTLDVNNAATSDINITGTGLLRVGGNITTAIFAGSTVTNTITLNGGSNGGSEMSLQDLSFATVPVKKNQNLTRYAPANFAPVPTALALLLQDSTKTAKIPAPQPPP